MQIKALFYSSIRSYNICGVVVTVDQLIAPHEVGVSASHRCPAAVSNAEATQIVRHIPCALIPCKTGIFVFKSTTEKEAILSVRKFSNWQVW